MEDEIVQKSDEETTLPKSTIHKIITDLLPPNITCHKLVKDIICDACLEFIHLLTSASQEISEKENKKMILAEHILSALNSLGFEEIVDDVSEELQDHQQHLKDRTNRSSRLEKSGLSEQELEAMQSQLFADAKKRLEGDKMDDSIKETNDSVEVNDSSDSQIVIPTLDNILNNNQELDLK